MLAVKDPSEAQRILEAVKLRSDNGDIYEELSVVRNVVIQQSCCKRAFIRGAFLSGGSMSDPQKAYHFEIVCAAEAKAMQLRDIINSFDLDAKIVKRKKHMWCI